MDTGNREREPTRLAKNEARNPIQMNCNLNQTGKCRPPRKDSAFTLVEIMVALVMAVIIFSSTDFALSTGFSTVRVARERLRANQICLSRMEGIRLCRWDDQLFDTNFVPLTFTEGFYPVGLSATNSFINYYGTLTLNTNFSMSPQPSYSGNLCLVTLTLTWTNQSIGAQTASSYSMTTIVSKNGIQNYVFSH
jgi:type II secretory pathway pseudopilin PulG